MKKIRMVWAEDSTHAIGKNGQLAWHLPDDLKLFKAETMNTLMVMGRTTWDTIGRPLPGRTSLVLTHQKDFKTPYEDVIIAHSVDEVLDYIEKETRDISIAGGAAIYHAFMPYATDLIVTRIDVTIAGDTFVDAIDLSQFKLVSATAHDKDDKHDYSFVVERYERQN
ncbi:dihydrofolate reductase [Leuconostoc citreum]|uniref:dihydrofolate reductase n=1 Tax=Leuconostoc citreum TaxID=33964 RepID=UPI001121ABED|nr:dihydrofolate reductase [Leuconostoc citreum]TOY70371.1 dihydrofolate reductase [Leuconostoc citreum]